MTGLTPKIIYRWTPVVATMIWSVSLKTSPQLTPFLCQMPCTKHPILNPFDHSNSYVLMAEIISLVLPSSFIHHVHQFGRYRWWQTLGCLLALTYVSSSFPSSQPVVAPVSRGVLSSLYLTCALLSISSQNALNLMPMSRPLVLGTLIA